MLKPWVTLDCPRFSKAFTRFNTILFLHSERLLHIQTCSRTNLQLATTDSKAVLRHPKICCCCWLCSWFYFSQCQKPSTAQVMLHPGLGWAHNPKWEAGRGSSAGALLPGSCCNSLTNHHISDLYSIPMKWECDSKAAQFDGKGDTKSPLNCMKTFWWQWWHLPKRWNQTPNRPHYHFSTHRPLILQAVFWHDDAKSIFWKGNKRQKKINYFLKTARDNFLQIKICYTNLLFLL